MLHSQKSILLEIEKVTDKINKMSTKLDMNALIYILIVHEHLRRCIFDYNNKSYSTFIDQVTGKYGIDHHTYTKIDDMTYNFVMANYVRINEFIKSLNSDSINFAEFDAHALDLVQDLNIQRIGIKYSNLISIEEFIEYLKKTEKNSSKKRFISYALPISFVCSSFGIPYCFKLYVNNALESTSYNPLLPWLLGITGIVGFVHLILSVYHNRYTNYSDMLEYINSIKSAVNNKSNIAVPLLNSEITYKHHILINSDWKNANSKFLSFSLENLEYYTKETLKNLLDDKEQNVWLDNRHIFKKDNNLKDLRKETDATLKTNFDSVIQEIISIYDLDITQLINRDSTKLQKWVRVVNLVDILCDYVQLQEEGYIGKLSLISTLLVDTQNTKSLHKELLKSMSKDDEDAKDGYVLSVPYIISKENIESGNNIVVDIINT